MNLLSKAISTVQRLVLGVSAEEIRCTFEDVRQEIRAVRADLEGEIAQLRRELDALPSRQDRTRGPELPVAEA